MNGFHISDFLYENPFTPLARIYWPYLLCTIALALLAFSLDRKRKGFSIGDFVGYLTPKSVYAHPSSVLDYKVFFLNQFILSVFFLPLLLDAPVVARAVHSWLVSLFGIKSTSIHPAFVTRLFLTLAVLVAADLGQFTIHYLMHRMDFLWRFHRVHHEAEVLTPVTLYRVHPVETFLRSTSVGIFSGVVFGLFSYLSSQPIALITILKINSFVFLFHIFGSNLRHSHIWIPYPKLISYIFISPAQHQIHHSNAAKHLDRNFGNDLAIWDWLLKTLYIPARRENLQFGIASQPKEVSRRSLVRFYLDPVWECLKSFKKSAARKTDSIRKQPELLPSPQ